MAEKTLVQRCGLTPVKGGMIAVLAIVLVVVVVSQFAGTDETICSLEADSNAATKQPPARGARVSVKPKATVEAARTPRRAVDVKPWPRISVEEATEFNPLKLPDSLAGANLNAVQAERDELTADLGRQEELDEQRRALRQTLQEAGVRMIVVGQHGKSAYIGTQLVREGDLIHGFVVKEIRPHGVELVDPQAE